MLSFLCIFFIIFFSTSINAQIYPPAVEIWSEPLRVDSLAVRYEGEGAPSLTTDMMKLFLITGPMVSVSHRIDTLWTLPVPLNSNINNGSPVRNPSISPDGKRLYYCRWGGYGGWDLWYSEWDTISNDWGPSINLGPNVNSPNIEYYAYELSEDTLYCINQVWADFGVCIYVRDSITNEWAIVDSSNYNHPFGVGDIRGLAITGDRTKAYFSKYILLQSDSLQSELFVTFWDSLNNRWGNVFELNINSNAFQPDTNNNFNWIGGWDEYPTISPDGKLMFFTSNRDVAREDSVTTPDIYVSILLYDHNGDPVNVDEIQDLGMILNDFLLLQNYPNPFNSTTNIRFYLPKEDVISLTVYDIIGNEIFKAINNQSLNRGWHHYQLNINKFGGNQQQISSGVYLYKLKTSGGSLSNKMLHLK
jgi:hypothetical protein